MKTLTLTDQTREGWWGWGFDRPTPPPDDWRHCYLRFGDLPKGGKSYAYSYNSRTGKHDGYYEPGVGVFQAYEAPEGSPDEYMVDLEMKPHLAAVYLRTMNRTRYLVEGPVVGYGAAT